MTDSSRYIYIIWCGLLNNRPQLWQSKQKTDQKFPSPRSLLKSLKLLRFSKCVLPHYIFPFRSFASNEMQREQITSNRQIAPTVAINAVGLGNNLKIAEITPNLSLYTLGLECRPWRGITIYRVIGRNRVGKETENLC